MAGTEKPMVKITLDGKELVVPAGTNLVEAAKLTGFEPAHFCYHPALSIVGQCRMCLCEVEKNPKLQIGCNTLVQEGMVVHFTNDRVKEAVKRNLEFHLVNHPIDCPICDQSGECVLQDYYMKHGKHKSHVPLESKVLKRKVVDLGPKIVLDQERCILCSRCVRYTAEITKTNELGYFNRGDHAVVATVNDRPLTGNYQENLVDICPVGALTSKDFRFRARVWYLKEFQSTCPGCSMGCSVNAHHKNQKQFFRLKPRYNKDVNGYWMCDEGRTTYKHANYDHRLVNPMIDEYEVPWEEALNAISPIDPNSTAVWMAPQFTHEEVETLFEALNKRLQIYRFYSEDLEHLISSDGPVDNFLLRKDRNMNTAGLRSAAKSRKINIQKTEFLIPLIPKTVRQLILFAPEFEIGTPTFAALVQAITPDLELVTVTSQMSVYDRIRKGVFLPTLSWLEKNGTITNAHGLTQPLRSPFRMFEKPKSVTEIAELWMKKWDNGREVSSA